MNKIKIILSMQIWLSTALLLAACGEAPTSVPQASQPTVVPVPATVTATAVATNLTSNTPTSPLATSSTTDSPTTTEATTSAATTSLPATTIIVTNPATTAIVTTAKVPPDPTSLPTATTVKSQPAATTPATVNPQPTAGVDNSPLLTVRTVGGLCQYGPCRTDLTVNHDGSFLHKDGGGAQRSGNLNKQLVSQLAAEIGKADFNAIKSKKFTGTCPSALDGQEFIYTFYLPKGSETISSCQYALDNSAPLFTTIQQVLNATK